MPELARIVQVAVHLVDVGPPRHAREDAAKDVDDHGQAATLGTGDGMHPGDRVGVIGRTPLSVESPGGRNRLALCLGEGNLAVGDRGCGHVEDHRHAVGGKTNGDRIGAEKGRFRPKGDQKGIRRGHHHAHIALGDEAQDVESGHAKMARVLDDGHAAPALLRQLHGPGAGMVRCHVAQAISAVHNPQGGCPPVKADRGPGHDGAVLQPRNIVGQTHDAVRIDAREIGSQQAVGNNGRIFPGNAHRDQHALDERREPVCRDAGWFCSHRLTSLALHLPILTPRFRAGLAPARHSTTYPM